MCAEVREQTVVLSEACGSSDGAWCREMNSVLVKTDQEKTDNDGDDVS